ncbi:MAG: hypothetical protein ABL883_09750 [Terricaulis sp.]
MAFTYQTKLVPLGKKEDWPRDIDQACNELGAAGFEVIAVVPVATNVHYGGVRGVSTTTSVLVTARKQC